MATPSCACGEIPFPGPVCITVPGAGPARGLHAAGPDRLQADGPSGTGGSGGGHLGLFLHPVFLPWCMAALALSGLLVRVIKMLINKRKAIEIIGTTSAAAENLIHGQRKQHGGEAARDFHRAGGDGARAGARAVPGKGQALAGDPPAPVGKDFAVSLPVFPGPPSLLGCRCFRAPARPLLQMPCVSASLWRLKLSLPDPPHPRLTSSSSLPRCENGEQCQGGSGHRGQLEKRREKAIVSEQGPRAGTK